MSRRNSANRSESASRALVTVAAAAAATMPFFLSSSASAVTLTWDANTGAVDPQDGGGPWTTAGNNWWNGTANVGWADGDYAIFGAAGPIAGTVSVTGIVTTSGMDFNVDGYTVAVTTPGSDALSVSGSTPINMNVSAGSTTITAQVIGTGSLNFNVVPTGIVNIGVNNLFSGGATLTGGGTVALGANGSGLGTGPVTLNGAALDFNNSTAVGNNIAAAASTTNTVAIGGNGTLNGALSGTGTLVHVPRNPGAGTTVSVGNANNSAFAGEIQTSGTIRFTNAGAGSGSANWNIGSTGAITTRLGTATIQLGAVSGLAGSILNGSSQTDGTTTYVVGGKNTDATFDGTIQNASLSRLTSIIKAGTGKWTLGGISVYGGNTTINGGTLALSSSGTLSIDVLGTISGTPLISVNNAAFDVSAAGFTVNNIQTLAGNNGTIYGAVTLGGGAISPGTIGGASSLSFSNNLTSNSGSFKFDINTPGTLGGGVNDLINVGSDLTFNGGTILATPTGAFQAGTYPLFTYGGSLGGNVNNMTLTVGVRGVTPSLVDAGGQVNLQLSGTPTAGNVTWASTGSTAWDVNTTANWFNTDTLSTDKYFQSDNVTFDDASSAVTNVVLAGATIPNSVVVDADTNNFTFSSTTGGFIGGSGSVTKRGLGTLTISTLNTYSGGTSIEGGTLVLGAINVLGSGSASLSGGNLKLGNFSDTALPNTINAVSGTTSGVGVQQRGGSSGANNATIGAISGSGTLQIITPGTLQGGTVSLHTLSVAGDMSGFSGTLEIGSSAQGFLRLNGTTGSSQATFNFTNPTATMNIRTGTTVQLGALMGSGNLAGTSTGATGVTWEIGGKNESTTFGGVISNGTAPTSITKVGTASLTLTGINTYTGVTTVQSGKLVLGLNAHTPVLNETNTPDNANVLGGRLIFDYNGGTTVASQVLGILDAGYDLPTKFSSGAIYTSNTPDTSKSLGWKDDTVAQQVVVAYTYKGDTNVDGQVTISDLGDLASNWQSTTASWAFGDFNYDGQVTISDLGDLASNWQAGVGSPLGMSFQEALAAVGFGGSAVPEPAMAGLLGLGLMGLASRRQRRN